jgi:hypothetical protein
MLLATWIETERLTPAVRAVQRSGSGSGDAVVVADGGHRVVVGLEVEQDIHSAGHHRFDLET